MQNILNLIKLNFINLYSLKKSFLFVVVFGAIMGFVNTEMMCFSGAMYLMIVCYTLPAYEERSKSNYLIASLPVTKKEYVLSKYIFTLINVFITTVFTIILNYIIKFIKPNIELTPLHIICITILAIGVFTVSILLPLVLIFGVEKGRYFLVFIAVLPICFSPTIMSILPKLKLGFLYNMSTTTSTMLLLLISITIILLSYFIVSNIYSKKEFN